MMPEVLLCLGVGFEIFMPAAINRPYNYRNIYKQAFYPRPLRVTMSAAPQTAPKPKPKEDVAGMIHAV
jgi:hypothetical protein